ATKTLALMASQAFGRSSKRGPWCLLRNSSACRACFAASILQLPRKLGAHNLSSGVTEVKPDRNAAGVCLKSLMATPASSRKIPFSAGAERATLKYSEKSEDGGCDGHRCRRGRSR